MGKQAFKTYIHSFMLYYLFFYLQEDWIRRDTNFYLVTWLILYYT
jgi:hypothetical protein